MEGPDLMIISMILMFIACGCLVYSVVFVKQMQKIIKSMKRRSAKYIREVVSNGK